MLLLLLLPLVGPLSARAPIVACALPLPAERPSFAAEVFVTIHHPKNTLAQGSSRRFQLELEVSVYLRTWIP